MASKQADIILKHIRTLVAVQRRNELPDQQLLHQFADQRDEAAFTALVRRHGPMVLLVCQRVLHNWHDADDAFQATFLTLARKANSIRRRESVGSWLHGVAYRLALQAKADIRRHARRGESLHRPSADPADEVSWRELRSVLDEELSQLPEKYRAPLLLCYLEGQTRDEAAQQLGCPLATLKSRLERGRELLRNRLSRRGLALSAALLATAFSESASAAMLPAMLVQYTVQAALLFAEGETAAAGIVSAQVASLVKGGLQAMGISKLKVGTAPLLGSIVAAGAGVLTHRALALKQADAKEENAPRALGIAVEQLAAKRETGRPQPAVVRDTNTSFVCSGQVVDPEGKPFAGAKIYLHPHQAIEGDPPVRTTTRADGRFQFDVSAPDRPIGGFTVVASAASYGPDWASAEDSTALANLTLRLVKDDVPIEGRLLTREGKPIAGAKVSVRSLQAFPGEDLGPYIQAVRDGKFYAFTQDNPQGPSKRLHGDFRLTPGVIPGLQKSVLSDAEGRFRSTGLGRERIVELNIDGTGIQSWYITVMTRPIQTVIGPSPLPSGDSVTVYGAAFEHLINPGRIIKGVVRDKKTGKPLAGIWVAGRGTNARVRTDDKGRYQLPGCPKAKEYGLYAGPDPGGMYFVSSATRSDQPGLEPINCDLQLVRGIPFRGKVLDKATGKSVRAAVSYFPIYPNANASEVPGYGAGGGVGAHSSDTTRQDGCFTCVVLPGPGAITVQADGSKYMAACVDPVEFFKGDPKDTFPYGDRDALAVSTAGNKGKAGLHQEQYQAIVLINPSNDTEWITRDIALEAARHLKGIVVGPDGNPVVGVRVRGLKNTYGWDTLANSAEFTMVAPNPARPRRMYFQHDAQRLVATVEVKGIEEERIRVPLQAWGAVTGQLLNADGEPWAEVEIYSQGGQPVGSLPVGQLHTRFRTNKDGKFRIEGLIPGLNYDLWFSEQKPRLESNIPLPVMGKLIEGLSVEAGETKELGTVKGRLVRGN